MSAFFFWFKVVLCQTYLQHLPSHSAKCSVPQPGCTGVAGPDDCSLLVCVSNMWEVRAGGSPQTADCFPPGPWRQGAFNWIVTLMSNKVDELIGHDQLRARGSGMANITRTRTHTPLCCNTPLMLIHWWLEVHGIQEPDVFDVRWPELRETKLLDKTFFFSQLHFPCSAGAQQSPAAFPSPLELLQT